MNIKIVKVETDTQIKKKDGGSYNGHKVTYEDEGEVKNKGFHEKVLEYRPELKQMIESLEEGKWYNVQMEKNDKGYWDWKDITEGSETSAPSNKSRQSGTKSFGGTKNFDNVGVGVGHALTNAVSLAVADGIINDYEGQKDRIKTYAYMIYDLSQEMQSEIRSGNRDSGDKSQGNVPEF